ncbi:MAG: proprotein convertase P-domain-containing protein [Pirellulales bacterium]|nr:proprotein convertase P-domain-containing protein [Pirellulales bacterium]
MLSSLGLVPEGLPLDEQSDSVENSLWISPASLLSEDSVSIPADAAGDASGQFAWNGWQVSSSEGSARQTAVFRYSFEGMPVVDDSAGEATVALPDEETWCVEGDPILPVRNSVIVLPQGAEILSVQVEPGPGTVIATDVTLAVTQATIGVATSEAVGDPAENVLSASFPESPGLGFSTHVMCGYRLGLLSVFPVQYDYGSKSLTYYPSLSVTVSTDPAPGRDTACVRASASDVERVARMVDNDSAIRDYRAEPLEASKSGPLPFGGPYEYVIITSADLADEFQPLVDHKISRGLTACIVTTDYIYANFTGMDTAGDNPDKIRDFIRAAYNGWSTQWVLLGGDTEGTNVPAGGAGSVVPHRGCYAGWDPPGQSYDYMATDIYFACLDGPWNGDGDNIWGERTDGARGGDVDLVPEVYLGRAPVDTGAEATNFVNKTILYESVPHPNPEWGIWLGEQVQWASPGPPPVSDLWGGDWKDQVDSECNISTAPNNWTLTKRYDKVAPWIGTEVHFYFGRPFTQYPQIHSIYASYTTGATTTSTVGVTSVLPYEAIPSALRAMPFTMSEAGTIQSISIYHEGDPAGGGLVMAVYKDRLRDGQVGADYRLGMTPVTAAHTTTGWQTVNLISPVNVAAGETVWLAFAFENPTKVYWDYGSPGFAQPDSAEAWSGGFAGDLNANAHIVNHMGHAVTWDNARLVREDVDALTNTHPYFMYSAGCLSGMFDRADGDCIAEHHVKGEHGAVAVVMNTREGWDIGIGSANYTLDRSFWYAIFHENLRQFGEALDYAKAQILAGAQNPNGTQSRWMYFDCTLFGDPETSLAAAGSPGGIAGTSYDDFNGNGQQDALEPGLSGRTVFLDADDDGQADQYTRTFPSADVPKALVDFTTTESTIRVTGRVGLVLDVNVTLDIAHAYDADLDVYLVSSSGRRVELFTDVDGSGDNFTGTTLDDEAGTAITSGGPPFAGSFRPEGSLATFDGEDANGLWTLEITDDAGGDTGTLNGWSLTITYGDPTALTDANGDYAFANLRTGPHVVREQLDAGWLRTEPFGGSHSVLVESGTTVAGVDFGSAQPADIRGRKWHDLDGDGVQDSGEPGLPGWIVYLDVNNNGIPDATPSTAASADVPIGIVDLGAVTSTLSVSGLEGLLLDVNVTLDIIHTYDADLDVFLVSPSGTSVELFTDVGGGGEHFTNTTIDDEAATLISSGTAPFTGSFRPEGSLSDLDGQDPNGAWSLRVVDDAGGDAGTLHSWSLSITFGDLLTETDGSGDYAFTGIAPGSYVVREQLQPGWIQTYPADDVLYGVAPFVDEGMLMMIDPDTGGAHAIGSTGAEKLVGLASDGAGALYTIADSGLAQRALHSVNPLTGELTRLFDLGVTGWGEGALALTGDGKAAYAVRTFLESPPRLYFMYNFMTTSPTVLDLGPLQYGGGTIASGTQVDGLAFRGDVLYGLMGGFSGGLSNHLVTIDTETREVIDVGSVGANIGSTGGLAYEPDHDRFYFAGAGSRWLYEVGPTLNGVYIMGTTGVDWLSGLTSGTSRGTPFEGAHIVLAASDRDALGVDFGNAQCVELRGSKFHDLNGNGLNEGDPPLAGWGVALDRNLNGRFDELTCYAESPDHLKPLPDLSASLSTLSVSGAPEVLRDVDVTLNLAHTFVGDLEAVLVSPEGTRVPLFYRVGGTGDDFYATILDDEASVPIGSGSAPFTGRFRPKEPLSAFDGEDPNGIWALELNDLAAGDSGTLQFWFLTLSCTEPVQETGPAGRYEFRDLAPGGYSVREVSQPGWLQTAPSAVPILLDDFDDNNMVEYSQIGAGSPAFTNPFAAHDGSYGAVAMTPTYRADPAATVRQGDVLSAWVRFANNPTGSASLMFGASATETLFVTLAADLQQIQCGHWQYAGSTDFLAGAGQRFEADTWYRVEAAWGNTGMIEIRLFGSDGTTLLNTITARHATITSGGIGLGGSGVGSVRQFDTITIWRDGARTVVLGSDERAEGLDFGNAQPAWIEGVKWLDRDGSGERDEGEPGMANWTVFVDVDRNAVRDEHVGVFTATAVPAPIPDFGTRLDYLTIMGLQGLVLDVDVTLSISHQHDQDLDVYLISPAGTRVELFTDVGGPGDHFANTTLDDEAAVSIAAGTAPFSGSYRPEGLLSVLDGQDPNGLWRLEVADDDPGVTGELMEWSITLTCGDPHAITGPGGLYEIAALSPGQYAVREEHQSGWLQTAPAEGYYDQLSVLSGEPTFGVDFGNARPGTICVAKYHDLDGDGQRGGNEPGLPDWEIFLDIDDNGSPNHDLFETLSGDTPLEIPDVRTVASEITVAGLVGLVLHVNIGLHIAHPYDSDLDVYLISPAGTRVELFTDVGGDGDDFFETSLDDDASISITEAAAPFTGTFRPEGTLADFLHEDPNGIWTLEVTDDAGGDLGRLEGWALALLVGDPVAVTDANGEYAFAELPPRDYVVREVLQEGWQQTAPAGGAHYVGLLGTQTADCDFGNRQSNEAPVIVGRHVFYNDSYWDTPTPQHPHFDDDTAVASDKTALCPGGTATFANYTSYSRGINGLMVDVADLPPASGTVNPGDYFHFRVGNNNTPGGWANALAPAGVNVRPGEGVDGSSRITIVWPDYAVCKQWLQVTVLANANTGLLEPDVFYFGNAVAEAGNSTTDAKVNATDMLLARNNPRTFLNPAAVDFPYDYNRDARVNATDMLLARNNQTHFLNALRLITVPAIGAAKEKAIEHAEEPPQVEAGQLNWLYELALARNSKPTSKTTESVDRLPAMYWQ